MKTTWRYTILKQQGIYFVAEEYSGPDGVYAEDSGHTSDVRPTGSTPTDLLHELEAMVKDIKKAIADGRVIDDPDDQLL